ncbi:MAG: hypothetical protein M3239_00125 [Thermoproteota archaeon]|nr:hypothetical protein [Thermoproteota archaeon]
MYPSICPTTSKNKYNLMSQFHDRKKWTGWDDLKPRPHLQLFALLFTYQKGQQL